MNDERGVTDLRKRTTALALRIIRLYSSLPRTDTAAQVLGRQVLRSGSSAGAHYREATRARSTAEFISKLEGGLQELEETAYWLELLVEAGIVAGKRLHDLRSEVEQVIAILVSSVRTAKRRRKAHAKALKDKG
jgi:four helix bundle protein